MVPIVNDLLRSKGTRARPYRVPAYPLVFSASNDDLLFELGCYWEGAIFYLHEVLHARSRLAKLKDIEERMSLNRALTYDERLFQAIWNSHGQIKWLKAHEIRRELLSGASVDHGSAAEVSSLAETTGNRDLAWLGAFISQHAAEGQAYPNPYFGGSNPLHLG